MSFTAYKVVNFGAAKASLATVGYTLLPGGTRVTAGVAELGTATGSYGATVTFADNFAGGAILWDTGEGSPAYHADEAVPAVNLVQIAGGPATLTNLQMTPAGYAKVVNTDGLPLASKADLCGISGTVNDTGPSATSFKLSSGFSSADGAYIGQTLLLAAADAGNPGESRTITGYTGATRAASFAPTLTYPAATGFSVAPVNGAAVTIV